MVSLKHAFKNLMSGGLLAFSCLFCSASVVSTAAQAQAEERVSYDRALITKLPSTAEDVGVAFLKTANSFPDFAKIVQDTDAYKNMNELAQKDYEEKQTKKLYSSYVNFSQKKTDLIIRVKVNVLFDKLANGEGIVKIRTFPDDPIYFPFYFAKYPIALIVKDMENFREIHLTKAETDLVYTRLSLSGDATLLLQLYSLAANDQKTMVLDNIPQYPFLAEIGYIGLLNNQAEQIWAWRNPKVGGKSGIDIGGRDLTDLVPDKEETGQ